MRHSIAIELLGRVRQILFKKLQAFRSCELVALIDINTGLT
jgi:hypothetical protein